MDAYRCFHFGIWFEWFIAKIGGNCICIFVDCNRFFRGLREPGEGFGEFYLKLDTAITVPLWFIKFQLIYQIELDAFAAIYDHSFHCPSRIRLVWFAHKKSMLIICIKSWYNSCSAQRFAMCVFSSDKNPSLFIFKREIVGRFDRYFKLWQHILSNFDDGFLFLFVENQFRTHRQKREKQFTLKTQRCILQIWRVFVRVHMNLAHTNLIKNLGFDSPFTQTWNVWQLIIAWEDSVACIDTIQFFNQISTWILPSHRINTK